MLVKLWWLLCLCGLVFCSTKHKTQEPTWAEWMLTATRTTKSKTTSEFLISSEVAGATWFCWGKDSSVKVNCFGWCVSVCSAAHRQNLFTVRISHCSVHKAEHVCCSPSDLHTTDIKAGLSSAGICSLIQAFWLWRYITLWQHQQNREQKSSGVNVHVFLQISWLNEEKFIIWCAFSSVTSIELWSIDMRLLSSVLCVISLDRKFLCGELTCVNVLPTKQSPPPFEIFKKNISLVLWKGNKRFLTFVFFNAESEKTCLDQTCQTWVWLLCLSVMLLFPVQLSVAEDWKWRENCGWSEFAFLACGTTWLRTLWIQSWLKLLCGDSQYMFVTVTPVHINWGVKWPGMCLLISGLTWNGQTWGEQSEWQCPKWGVSRHFVPPGLQMKEA